MEEIRRYTIDGDVIEYKFVRRKMKTIRLRITSDGTLAVSCPMRTPIYEVERVIAKNKEWIKTTREHTLEQMPKEPKREYYTGEKYLFLGDEYTLLVMQNPKEGVELKSDYIFLSTRSLDDYDRKKRLLDKWYIAQTEKIFKQRFYALIEKFRDLFPYEYQLKIRSMTARWGSCMINRNTVVLNSRLIYADESLIDYVICHELSHFKFKNHDKDFYAMLTYLCPDWKERKKLLGTKYIYYVR
ncbi:MAG: M48 family metallopeptidase [Clostridiales bacterium]|nr:M48 family metallopeptidase [Clostridiales bacterium]